jgi:hypothetical protein
VFGSTWEFYLQRLTEPLVHKRFVGCLHNGDSYSVAVAAPAADYDKWKPVFERFVGSFRFKW